MKNKTQTECQLGRKECPCIQQNPVMPEQISEWKKEFEKLNQTFGIIHWTNKYAYQKLEDFISSLLQKRDEYWRRKIEKILDQYTDKEFGTVDYEGFAAALIMAMITRKKGNR